MDTDYDWMVLEPLAHNDWLVIDRDQATLTGDGVIGHIQLLFGVYETLNRSDPLGRSFFETLDSAVEYFAPWPRNAQLL
jgi:hypothetical protein